MVFLGKEILVVQENDTGAGGGGKGGLGNHQRGDTAG